MKRHYRFRLDKWRFSETAVTDWQSSVDWLFRLGVATERGLTVSLIMEKGWQFYMMLILTMQLESVFKFSLPPDL
jgi:hypothetical protein